MKTMMTTWITPGPRSWTDSSSPAPPSLPQPESDQHFLRMFGQSDRQIPDSNTEEGSIPQVLMLMNGEAQGVLRNPKSLVLSHGPETGLAREADRVALLQLLQPQAERRRIDSWPARRSRAA